MNEEANKNVEAEANVNTNEPEVVQQVASIPEKKLGWKSWTAIAIGAVAIGVAGAFTWKHFHNGEVPTTTAE